MKPKFKLLFIILLIPALTKSQTLEPVKIIGTDFISGTGKFFPVVMNYSVDAVYRIDQNGNNEYFIARITTMARPGCMTALILLIVTTPFLQIFST
ncbi:MAG: hypothetical protein IPP34_16600 [Bacteroidetes bacterium]|nr:hypothetical protein [Bacteroidota bacterium]MBL0073334.1 hypothetical protein [Bacteroidota bacterium]